MTVRAFNEKDYLSVLNIYSKAKLDELRYEKEVFELLPLEKDEVRLKKLIESEIYLYDSGGILGYGAVCGQEVRALFVLPESRGKGVGKAIFEFLMEKITGDISLCIAASNFPAKRFYEKYGFKTIETFETVYNGLPVCANKMVCTNRGER